jgi:hypothetical protein
MSPPPPQMLLQPLRRLLRPLVRLAILSGVTFPVMTDLLRGLFVEVASRDLLTDTASRTDSRISLLTGVHRKEIRRLRLEMPAGDLIPPVVTISSQIIALWLAAEQYSDAKGGPLVLPRLRPAEAGPSFETLVESVTTDVRPRAVLDDLLAHGIVILEPGDQVRLNQAAFIPRPGSSEQLFFFGRNLHDHIAAAVANVAASGEAKFVDSSVHYDQLTSAAAAQLMAIAQSTAEKALLDVNRAAIGLAEPGGSQVVPPAVTRRVNFGIYLYTEDDAAVPEEDN